MSLGTDPAHVAGSTTSSPDIGCDRKLDTTSGEICDRGGDSSSRRCSDSGISRCYTRGSRRSRFGTRREWRGEKRQHGETDLTLVGDAQFLVALKVGERTRCEGDRTVFCLENSLALDDEEHEIRRTVAVWG